VAADEGVEREGAALTAVVRTEHDEHVLEEGDESERPEDEGEDAVDLLVARRVLDIAAGEGALVDVERRRGHVTVHHPEALVREQQRRAPRIPPPLLRTDRQATNQSGLRTRKKARIFAGARSRGESSHTHLPVRRCRRRRGAVSALEIHVLRLNARRLLRPWRQASSNLRKGTRESYRGGSPEGEICPVALAGSEWEGNQPEAGQATQDTLHTPLPPSSLASRKNHLAQARSLAAPALFLLSCHQPPRTTVRYETKPSGNFPRWPRTRAPRQAKGTSLEVSPLAARATNQPRDAREASKS
jgi:hypothetical protein